MNERIFARLALLLAKEPVVLATVLDTRGATPRKRGSRMLITLTESEFSIGGGLAEARVIAAARELIAGGGKSIGGGEGNIGAGEKNCELGIDLSGKPDAAGICGGQMQLALRLWNGSQDRVRAQAIASELADGKNVDLSSDDLGSAAAADRAEPNERLLIVGGGHCGLALYQLAAHLDFDLWVFDAEPERVDAGHFPQATRLSGDCSQLALALDTLRSVHAVLLNRDYQADIDTLRALAQRPPAFVSMMGSPRRIAQVRAALPEYAEALAHLTAPVGLDIGARTPHEIAVSILAQVIADRHAVRHPVSGAVAGN